MILKKTIFNVEFLIQPVNCTEIDKKTGEINHELSGWNLYSSNLDLIGMCIRFCEIEGKCGDYITTLNEKFKILIAVKDQDIFEEKINYAEKQGWSKLL